MQIAALFAIAVTASPVADTDVDIVTSSFSGSRFESSQRAGEWEARRESKARRGGRRRSGRRSKKNAAKRVQAVAAETVASPIPKNLPARPELQSGAARSVALLPLDALEVGEELVHAIEVALLSEIDEQKGLIAVTPRDVTNELTPLSLDPSKCDGDVRCIAISGAYSRCHLAMAVKVAALGGTLSVSMRLIDTQTGREIARVGDPISHDATARAKELHRMAVQLLAPETYVGTLTVNSSQSGADVYLDDRLVGTTPIKQPLSGLAAGPHILRVSKPGFSDLNRFVDVVYNRNSTITVDLASATVSGKIVEKASETGFGSLFVASNVGGVEVRVDGEPKGVTPLDAPIEKIAAGKRRLSFRKEGLPPQVQELEVAANQRTDLGLTVTDEQMALEVVLASAASAPLPRYEQLVAAVAPVAPEEEPALRLTVPPPEKRSFWGVRTGFVLGGIGAASILASSYFSWRVTDLEGQRDDWYRKGEDATNDEDWQTARDELAAINDSGERAELFQWITLGGGITFAAIGGGLVLWDLFQGGGGAALEAPGSENTVRLDALPSADGGARFVLSGRW